MIATPELVQPKYSTHGQPSFEIIVNISHSLRGIGTAPVAFLTEIKQSHLELRHFWAARTTGRANEFIG